MLATRHSESLIRSPLNVHIPDVQAEAIPEVIKHMNGHVIKDPLDNQHLLSRSFSAHQVRHIEHGQMEWMH